ncbi:ATP-binding protein [Streptosporangium sp. NPDC051022]|uniref:ATP-binding protein n=1 Tax=Streptosporangium sp. NPDC051022 TaxID=3155752 RepID=UPI003443CB8B
MDLEESCVESRWTLLGAATFDLAPEVVSQARARLREWLGTEHPAYERTELVVSELVANSVVHSTRGRPYGNKVTLTVTSSEDRIYVQVIDPGGPPWNPVVPDEIPIDQENGRGLWLVARHSRSWGVRDYGSLGRAVWAVLDVIPVTGTETEDENV